MGTLTRWCRTRFRAARQCLYPSRACSRGSCRLKPSQPHLSIRLRHPEQQTLLSAGTNHDTEITIGQSEIRLIASADHRQANRPAARVGQNGLSKQAPVNVIKSPGSTPARTEDELLLEGIK